MNNLRYYYMRVDDSKGVLTIAYTPYLPSKRGREFALALSNPHEQFTKVCGRFLTEYRLQKHPLFLPCEPTDKTEDFLERLLLLSIRTVWAWSYKDLKRIFHFYYGFNFKETFRNEQRTIQTPLVQAANQLGKSTLQGIVEDPFAFLDSVVER